jgi:hypothetical protein
MCVIDLDPCDVWHETRRKARKEHKCSCCGRTVRKGETYLVHFDIFEGRHNSEKCCAECEQDRNEFCKAHGSAVCSPGYFPVVLEECVSDDPDDEDGNRWEPMLERLVARRKERGAS